MAGTWSDEQIAVTLNRKALRTGLGKLWTKNRVNSYRMIAGIPAYASARKDGRYLTLRDAAIVLDVTSQVLRRLIQKGALAAKQVVPGAPWQIRARDLKTPSVQQALRIRRRLGKHLRRRNTKVRYKLRVQRGDAQ